jgi:hypothetical protein
VTLEALLSRLVTALERAEVPYMLTGSVASSAHGIPRSTRDLDIVIAPTPEQLRALIREFPDEHYYADESQALQALATRSQFNVIEFATGWKLDFIIAHASDYGRAAIARRQRINVAGVPVWVATAEDVIIAKLQWAKRGESARQLQDVAGIISTQGSQLDRAYLDRWVRELELQEQWQLVSKSGSG